MNNQLLSAWNQSSTAVPRKFDSAAKTALYSVTAMVLCDGCDGEKLGPRFSRPVSKCVRDPSPCLTLGENKKQYISKRQTVELLLKVIVGLQIKYKLSKNWHP